MSRPSQPKHPPASIAVGNVRIGAGQPLAIIAGPCVAESLDLCLTVAQAMRDRCAQLGLGYIFKASFDKANRSSIGSARGPGLDEGRQILQEAKDRLGVPVTTDIHEPEQASLVGPVVDLIQVPAFLCRQTDLLLAAASTGKPVNVKKGQFMSPAEMGHVVHKLRHGIAAGPDVPAANGIMLTERGTFFGYHRLVNDFVGLGDLLELGLPVCFDVTHSTQMPGAETNASGGRPDRAPLLARCALAAGVHALFVETHPNPSSALSDAATMVPLDQTLCMLDQWATLHRLLAPTTVR